MNWVNKADWLEQKAVSAQADADVLAQFDGWLGAIQVKPDTTVETLNTLRELGCDV